MDFGQVQGFANVQLDSAEGSGDFPVTGSLGRLDLVLTLLNPVHPVIPSLKEPDGLVVCQI